MDLSSYLARKGHRNGESTASCNSSIIQQVAASIYAWIILVFCFIGYSCAEISRPLNQAGATGTQIRLTCSASVDDRGDWDFDSSLENKGSQVIYMGSKISEKWRDFISIEDSANGQMDLKIKLSDKASGKYKCRPVPNSKTTLYTVQVVVLDAKPECSKEENPDFVKASCSISFSGYWHPKLEWSSAKGKLETDDKQTTQDNRVNSTITISKTNSDILTCTPKFTLDKIPPDTTEKNIPEYSSSCTLTISSTETATDPSTEKSVSKSDPKSDPKSDDKSESKSDDKSDDKSDTKTENRSSPAFVSNRNGLSLYLCQCLATMAFIGMLHKWLWQ